MGGTGFGSDSDSSIDEDDHEGTFEGEIADVFFLLLQKVFRPMKTTLLPSK